jgi:hypothetical protein
MTTRILHRVVITATLLLLILLPLVSDDARAQNLTCDDFRSQAQAQSNLRSTAPKDPNGLDKDGNGIACDVYPYPLGAKEDRNPIYRTQEEPTLPYTGGDLPLPSETHNISTSRAQLATSLMLAGAGALFFILLWLIHPLWRRRSFGRD